MARPKNKTELIELAEKNYSKLIQYIFTFPEQARKSVFPEGTMNRNIRDVLAHLYEWHNMFKKWYEVGMLGKKPEIPAAGYTWKTTPDLNKKIWEQYRNSDLQDVLKWFEDSHKEIMSLIKKHSNEELFEKRRYKWTGTTSLGAYLISATSSHYDWAFKLIKKAMKVMA